MSNLGSEWGVLIALEVSPPRRQTAIRKAAFFSWDLPSGPGWASFYRTPAGITIRFHDLADFVLSPDGSLVRCIPVPEVSEATLEHLYRNQVYPLALSKLGKLVVHGSAVEHGTGAISFLGESGRGKSTLAAAFALSGQPFLTDDALVIESADNNEFLAYPSPPSLRLWVDSRDFLLKNDFQLAPAVEYTSKDRLLADARLEHCVEPRTLHAVYFLGDGSASKTTVRPIPPVQALIKLVNYSFLLDMMDPALIKSNFEKVADLAKNLACFELDYPRKFETIDQVVAAIGAHAASLTNGEPVHASKMPAH